MPQRIGFDRKIKRDWIDLGADAVQQSHDVSAVNALLHKSLADEITGNDARRKSINVLTRIWLRPPDQHASLCEQAVTFWPTCQSNERLILHWGLTLLAYPFFRDVTAHIGRFNRLQTTFTITELHQAIVAHWGERNTIKYAVPRVTYSLEDWGMLVRIDTARGQYQAAPKYATENQALVLWLLECALRANLAEALPLYDLLRLPELFPFELNIELGILHTSSRFLVIREGTDRDMVMLANGKS